MTEVTRFLFLLMNFSSDAIHFNKSDNMCLDVIKLETGSQPHPEKKDLAVGSIWTSKSSVFSLRTHDVAMYLTFTYI